MADEGTCTSPKCDARVLWVRNIATGSKLILDVEPIPDGELKPGDVGVVRNSGRVLRSEHLDGGQLTSETRERCHEETKFFRSHWATCPDKDRFKR